MPVIALSKVAKAYGTQVLLDDVTLSVDAGDRVGVVGPNGAGKTTLLRLMAAREEPTRGDVHLARGTRMGLLDQEPDFRGHGTVFEAAHAAFAPVHALGAEIAELREKLAAGPADAERLLRRQGELEHEFERLGGYTTRSRTEAVLDGLGFRGEALAKPVERLSGGERSRLAIAYLLVQEADVLLLDEPTNHLDLDGLEWLERYLGGFPGAVVVVSHDRRFLDGFARKIFDFEGARIQVYRGNYSDYVPQKAQRLALRRKRYEAQQELIARERDFIQRNIAGQRGREARGRRTRLERLERLERPRESQSAKVRIEPQGRGGNEVLNLEGVSMGFEGRPLFADLTLQVLRGDRIGIVGPNGAGKTTLFRILVGEQRPTGGSVRLGQGISLAYYRQDRLDLDPDQTVLDAAWSRAPQAMAGEMRNLLALLLFTGDDVLKRVGDLSGGEQARVALARLILSAPNLLLLDEPTNHLDIPSRMALEAALEAYQGTVLLASHDRYVLDRVAGKVLEIRDGRARLYPMPYARYAERAGRQQQTEGASSAEAPRPRAPARRPRRRTARPLEVVERLILEREDAVETLQHAMSDPQIYKSPDTVRSLTGKLQSIRDELAELYDEWDEAADAGAQ
ncbi:MAG: ABC-F family ATP-binding cassette domain-containing protein [Candidatus Brocadiia bacterium]